MADVDLPLRIHDQLHDAAADTLHRHALRPQFSSVGG
jgi:hypothetical protein